MNPNNKHAAFYQAGFSLIEIMVGLVIGLLASLVIMQVFSVFEGQKRTTTGTADAQTNGSIALYTVQRELQMAGYGLLPTGEASVADSAIECTALTIDAATGIGDISPVTITDGGAASDSITIRYSTTDTGGIPSQIRGVGVPAAGDVTVDNNLGCQDDDIALIMNGNSCFLTAVTALSAPPPPAPASAVPATITLQDITGAVTGANFACLGAWREITYAVNNGNLERNAVARVVDIVNIQAQYGIGDPAAANPNRVVQWVNATGAWAAPTAANRNRIKAVRAAVVARNGLMEKEAVTFQCSSLTADPPLTGLCSWSGTSASPDTASPAPAIDLSGDADWQRYRYRVFETIIPLRNVIWSKSTL
ncbi:MAG: PilW family protein [Gallionella sp.]|nr:PilW family protein [Gallionella sp.]